MSKQAIDAVKLSIVLLKNDMLTKDNLIELLTSIREILETHEEIFKGYDELNRQIAKINIRKTS